MTADTLVFDNVTVCYHKTPAVHHLSATVHCGKLTALMGPNGAGKSTLMRATLGLMPLTTGRITIAGVDSTRARQRIAWLPQRSTIDWDFPLTIREVVAQGRYPALGWWRGFSATDHQAVDAALDELGLSRLADRPIAALSGGQQQRVLLSRALASGADILLLDEPFNGLDAPACDELVKLLRGWAARGRLVMAAIHDLALAKQVCDEALVIRTHLVSCGPVSTALSHIKLSEAFGDTHLPNDDHGDHDHAHAHAHAPAPAPLVQIKLPSSSHPPHHDHAAHGPHHD